MVKSIFVFIYFPFNVSVGSSTTFVWSLT